MLHLCAQFDKACDKFNVISDSIIATYEAIFDYAYVYKILCIELYCMPPATLDLFWDLWGIPK